MVENAVDAEGTVESESNQIAGVRDVAEGYPECGTVTVCVDRHNPDRSSLSRRSNTLQYLGLSAVGPVILGLGLRSVVRRSGC